MIHLKIKCRVYGKTGVMSEIFSILSRNNRIVVIKIISDIKYIGGKGQKYGMKFFNK